MLLYLNVHGVSDPLKLCFRRSNGSSLAVLSRVEGRFDLEARGAVGCEMSSNDDAFAIDLRIYSIWALVFNPYGNLGGTSREDI